MKKVLIIAYAFPPVGGVGVQRVTKFVKYLRDFDWEPLVLTVANPSVPIIDEALLQDIPDGVKIFRASSFEPSYDQKQTFSNPRSGVGARLQLSAKKLLSGLLLPDVQVLWWPDLICRLISIIRHERPNCIFVTAPPFSAFLPVVAIGALLKIPVVADFRDEWSFSREQWENTAKGKIVRFLDRVFEKYVVSRCTAITTATQSYINSLDRQYRLPKTKGTVITNGYDEEDYLFTKRKEAICDNHAINMLYTGTAWKGSSLQNFSTALLDSLVIKPEVLKKFRFKTFGRVVDSELSYLTQPGLENMVEMFGYIEHEKIIQEMCGADILLLVISDVPGAEKIIVAKTFEYMATGKHIFAIVPEGETKNLLAEQYGNVTFANPGDILDIRAKLLGIILSFGEIRTRRGKGVSQFSRKHLTGQLAEVLNSVVVN